MESLDPQLKNNTELVATLEKLEESWSLALNQISDKSSLKQLRAFSEAIETAGRNYKEFKENLECCDASIFMSLPSLFVLRSL